MTIDPRRDSDGGDGSMLGYRLFFVNEQGTIEARLEFFCADDVAAAALSELLFDACSDCHSDYELWQERRRVLPAGARSAAKPLDPIVRLNQPMQDQLLELEEQLLQSQWRLAQSQRLLGKVNMLRAQLRARRQGATDEKF